MEGLQGVGAMHFLTVVQLDLLDEGVNGVDNRMETLIEHAEDRLIEMRSMFTRRMVQTRTSDAFDQQTLVFIVDQLYRHLIGDHLFSQCPEQVVLDDDRRRFFLRRQGDEQIS